MKNFKSFLFCGAALVAPLFVDMAYAQEAAEAQATGGLGDIIVTARRQGETLIDVPVAVTALGAEDVSRYASGDITEISRLAPQVMVVEGFSGSGATFSIRGLGSSSNDAGIEQAVSVVLDGVQISRGRIVTAGMFDIQQVEVLKGPQALFFGKNSPAGVMSFKSADPTNELAGYLTAGYEFNADQWIAEGAVGGPVTDTLGARLAFKATDMKGWLNNTNQPAANPVFPAYPFPGSEASRLPGKSEYAARLSLKWDPADNINVGLKISGGIVKVNSFAGTLQQWCRPGIVPVIAGVPNPGNDCTFDENVNSNVPPTEWISTWPVVRDKDGQAFYKQKWFVASLPIEYAINDDLSLSSISGYAHLNTTGFGESQGGDIGYIFNANPEKSDNFTQEIRLTSSYDAPINFMLGAFYEKAKRTSTSYTRIVNFGSPDPVTGKWYTYDRVADVDGETVSAFGSLNWEIIENLELSGGVRYTHETKDQNIRHEYLDSRLIAPASPTAFRTPGDALITSLSISNWSPEVTLNWHPIHNSTVYVAYKTGFKSGGFSNPGQLRNNYDALNVEFGPESAKGFELGVKGQFLNNTLRAEFAAYTYNFSGLQLSSFDGATITYQVRNAAKARTRGAELQLQWQPVRELNLRSAIAYNEGRYLDFTTAQCWAGQTSAQGCNPLPGQTLPVQDLTGEPIVRAPDWVINFGATYALSLGGNLGLEFSGDANYSSSYFTSDNNDPFAEQPGFWLLNAAVRLHEVDDKWELSLIGKNLTDKIYLLSTADNVVTQNGQYFGPTPRTRQILLQAKYKF